MRWAVAALAVGTACLWVRVSAQRRRLDRLDVVTGAWQVAEPWPAPTGDVELARMEREWLEALSRDRGWAS